MNEETFLPYAKHSMDESDVQSMIEAIRGELISQGPILQRFEERVAQYCGCQYAVAVSSGTAALHLACLAVGLGPGKRFWTTPLSFIASANCGLYAGAEVDFVDICPSTLNLDIDLLEQKLENAEKEGQLPDVLIPVHFAGLSCPMKRINELADKYRFKVIEDGAHALGGEYLGKKIGSCCYSNILTFSFHPIKSITTGEGGMILTNEEETYQKLLRFRSHGITKDPDILLENHGPWYYEQHELGFNYRITEFQCALGLSQMNRLDEFIGERVALSMEYGSMLENMPLRVQGKEPDCNSAWHLFVIRLNTEEIGKTRREVFDELRESNIGAQVHYLPIPMHPYYRRLGFSVEPYPEVKQYYEEALSLPLFPELVSGDLVRIVNSLRTTLEVA